MSGGNQRGAHRACRCEDGREVLIAADDDSAPSNGLRKNLLVGRTDVEHLPRAYVRSFIAESRDYSERHVDVGE